MKVKSIKLFIIDILFINLSYLFSLILRFDGEISGEQFITYFNRYLNHFIVITAIKLLVFVYFKLYNRSWRYASIDELFTILVSIAVANTAVISYLFIVQEPQPRSVYIIATMIDMGLVGGVRLGIRGIKSIMNRSNPHKGNFKHILIVGAGDAGNMILREYKSHQALSSKVVAFVDDDPKKNNQILGGVPVLGNRNDIPAISEKYVIDEIVIAIPSASKKEIAEIVEICKKTRARLKILPGIYELIDGVVSLNSIREVQIEDLLGREEIVINTDEISSYIKDKIVLVTGGGGSIGSELCRQIAKNKPKRLVLIDIYENTTYSIQNELLKSYKDLDLKVYIASVRDKRTINELVGREKPNVVFHAAAHKHVPLMEGSPKEAIKNNVFGTHNVALASSNNKVEKFVLISTDKAVNPTNIMGASKRLSEMLIQSLDSISETEFVAVRFGNVLGSNGSVIPLFKKQIEEGGPVTVTHEEVIRYFMTIPEAVRLVMQAGAIASGGEIFILDMGKPVKILELAEDLIRLSGFEPYTEIPIQITGLRPGEKLFEELLMDEEGIKATKHDKIFIAKPSEINYERIRMDLEHLFNVAQEGQELELKEFMSKLVPTYRFK